MAWVEDGGSTGIDQRDAVGWAKNLVVADLHDAAADRRADSHTDVGGGEAAGATGDGAQHVWLAGAWAGAPTEGGLPPESFGLTTPVRQGIGNTSAIGTEGNFTNQDINGILSGFAWDATKLTFSFPTKASNYGSGYSNPNEPAHGFQAMIDEQQDVVRYALGLISSYTGLEFKEVKETDSNHATLRFAGSTAPGTSWAYYPYPHQTGGDVWVGNIMNDEALKAGYAFDTLLHELGHALGLKHGHQDDGVHGVLPTAHDSTEWSTMTYHAYLGADEYYNNAEGSGNQTYMMNDIAALQYLYGASYAVNAEATTYSWNKATGEMSVNGAGQGAPSENKVYLTLWDGGGTDTFDLSTYKTDLSINLEPGEWSVFSQAQLADLDQRVPGEHLAHGNVANAHLFNNDPRSLIENAFGGTGKDAMTGNLAKNLLRGGDGNDTLSGMEGKDTLEGDAGKDRLLGGTENDLLRGGDGDDLLVSGAGLDTLVGGLGGDELRGGKGGDFFVYLGLGDCAGDLITDLTTADTIDLSAIDANTKASAPGDQAFKLVGAFSGKAGEAMLKVVGDHTELRLDTDGDKVANAVVTLAGDQHAFDHFVL